MIPVAVITHYPYPSTVYPNESSLAPVSVITAYL